MNVMGLFGICLIAYPPLQLSLVAFAFIISLAVVCVMKKILKITPDENRKSNTAAYFLI